MKVSVTGKLGGVFLDNLKKRLPAQQAKAVLAAAQETTGVIRSTVYSVFPSGRTGGLARSYKETFLGWSGDTVSAGSFSSLEYAGVQDRGGTIRPRVREYLAIPLERMAVGKWPRHFGKSLTLIKSKKGNLLLVQLKKNGTMKPMFVLKKSVTLRGRRYLEAAAREAAPRVEEIVGVHASLAISEAEGGK